MHSLSSLLFLHLIMVPFLLKDYTCWQIILTIHVFLWLLVTIDDYSNLLFSTGENFNYIFHFHPSSWCSPDKSFRRIIMKSHHEYLQLISNHIEFWADIICMWIYVCKIFIWYSNVRLIIHWLQLCLLNIIYLFLLTRLLV